MSFLANLQEYSDSKLVRPCLFPPDISDHKTRQVPRGLNTSLALEVRLYLTKTLSHTVIRTYYSLSLKDHPLMPYSPIYLDQQRPKLQHTGAQSHKV